MPIPFTNYVEITSGVGGNNAVRQRDLILRLFTENVLVPTGGVIEFETIDEVGAYFGTASVEYLRAQFYFGWVSKDISAPQKISFARWANVAVAPQIFGDSNITQTLANWTPITSGAFGLTIGGVVNTFTGLDFSGAASLAAVAAIIQAAIRTKTGAQWTGATVAYDATRDAFTFTGGVTGAAAISVQSGGGADISVQLGWNSIGTIISPGAAAQSLTDVMTSSTQVSNNFGSFNFIPSLTTDQITELATWNDTQNVDFIFLVPVSSSNASAISAAIIGYAGSAMTLSPISTEYPELIPGMILAATDYTRRNSVQNYMFQIFPGLTASVTDGTAAAAYDAIRVNYYGNTQTAGQVLQFYQRGTLTGGSQDPVDQNTYANEMWLKDTAGAAIMALLLSLARVSANSTGVGQILSTLQPVIQLALTNGVISTGKPLNSTQQLFITQVTGDPLAWHAVQNQGYVVSCVVQSYVTTDSRTEWKAVYTLVYSKDDDIRKVEGTHILI